MIFRQLFEHESCTYSYLIGCEITRKAVMIDTVKSEVNSYLSLLKELNLTLIYVLDTHTHADHITASGKLRDATGARTLLGEEAHSICVSQNLHHGDELAVGELKLGILHTPGHTDDSYSFILHNNKTTYAFTGDTLLIGSTGRTDFQNGNAADQYHSIHNYLLSLPKDTLVYPAHDYNGRTLSTIGEEIANNLRLQVKNVAAYVELMNNLHLPNPKLMDVAISANRACGEN